MTCWLQPPIKPGSGGFVGWHLSVCAYRAGSALLLSLLVFGAPALSKDDGRYQHVAPDIRTWVEKLTNRYGKSCCSTADGYEPEGVEWNASANAYMIRLA